MKSEQRSVNYIIVQVNGKRVKITWPELVGYSSFGFFILILLNSWLGNPIQISNWVLLTTVALFIISLLGSLFQKENISFSEIGTLSIMDNEIKINKQSYPYTEIANMKFRINNHKEMASFAFGSNAQSPKPKVCLGIDNYIKFNHQGSTIEFRILLETPRRKKHLEKQVIPFLLGKTTKSD